MTHISFLVPCYNNADTIAGTLRSINSQKTGFSCEVVIVDDGSSDDSVTIIEQCAIGSAFAVRLIKKQHGGESSALNCGLAHCGGEYVAIVEADVELDENWLTRTCEEFADKAVMGAGGTIETFRSDNWIARIAGYEIEYKFLTKPRQVKHISSANAIYRREIFDIAGRFEEKLMNASLDADFNARVIDKGYTLIYCKDAIARHHCKTSLGGYLKRYYAYARYRVHLKYADLYPQDNFLSVNVIFCALLPVACLWYFSVPALTYLCLAFVLCLQLPQTFRLLAIKRDAVLAALPFILVLRNVVAGAGYAAGFLHKIAGAY